MKILRLSNSVISCAIADKYVDSNSGKVHFNINHGSRGTNTWRWYACLHDLYFKSEESHITLDGDAYELDPVMRNGSPLVDSKDNQCYNVVMDNDPCHKNDILLLWTIPGRGYDNVEYSVTGNIELIGEGSSGKSRLEGAASYPSPILLISGDCKLHWSGVNSNGDKVSQNISYDYWNTNWGIEPVESGGCDD